MCVRTNSVRAEVGAEVHHLRPKRLDRVGVHHHLVMYVRVVILGILWHRHLPKPHHGLNEIVCMVECLPRRFDVRQKAIRHRLRRGIRVELLGQVGPGQASVIQVRRHLDAARLDQVRVRKRFLEGPHRDVREP